MTTDFEELAEMIDTFAGEGQLPLLVYSIIASLILAFSVIAVFFILKGIGLYRINRRLGNRYAWLAFVPGLSGYALGAAADGLKKRRPSNYCIHMLMLNLFYTVLNVINYIYIGGRFLFLYEKLAAGEVTDTEALLESVFMISSDDKELYFLNFALQLLSYVVTFVTLLCFMRILKLFRRGGFILLLCSVVAPQVMDVYLFVMRNASLYPKPPVYRLPDGTLLGEGELDESEAQDIYPRSGADAEEPYGEEERTDPPEDGADADRDDDTHDGQGDGTPDGRDGENE